MIKFGLTIKYFRVLKGLKQTELAMLCGVQPTYISMLENDKKEPSLSLLRSISEVLDTDSVTFFQDAINQLTLKKWEDTK